MTRPGPPTTGRAGARRRQSEHEQLRDECRHRRSAAHSSGSLTQLVAGGRAGGPPRDRPSRRRLLPLNGHSLAQGGISMRLTSRRPSAALIVALVALFVAMAGTAAAAVIISSPDQLGDGVVTERALAPGAVSGSKLADGAVHGVHEVNPHLSARVNANGTKP